MADAVSIEIAGLDAVSRELRALAVEFGARAGGALRTEGELVMTEAKRRTPVLTGTLRNSGHVTGPDESAAQAVRLAFGGPAAPYAVPVHENLEAQHPTGEAKFLERPLNEAVAGMPGRMAARMARG